MSANTLFECLNGASLTQVQEIIKSMQCEVSFCNGRKFVHHNYSGAVTYNQVIDSVYDKIVNGKFCAHIDRIPADLARLHQLGEEELDKNDNIFTLILTLIKRFFTSFGREEKLQKITQKITEFFEPQKQYLADYFNDLASVHLNKDNIHVNSLDKGVSVQIFPLRSPQRSNYVLGDNTKSDSFDFIIQEDSLPSNKEAYLNLIKKQCQNLYPLWAKANAVLNELENKNYFENYLETHPLLQLKKKKELISELIYNDIIYFSYRFSEDARSIFLVPNFKLVTHSEIIGRDAHSFKSSFSINLDDIHLSPSDIINVFKEKLEIEMDDFLLRALGEKKEKTANYIDMPIDAITTIEDKLEESGKLILLAKKKKYADLRKELKKMERQAQLSFHPDRITHTGLTKEEAEENFKEFDTAARKFHKWLDQQPATNVS